MPITPNIDPPIAPTVLVFRLCSSTKGEGEGDGGDDGLRAIISLVTVAGLPPFWRSITMVEPRTSPEDDTAAAPTYRQVMLLLAVSGMAVSKP
jgi:hypothetical protein